MKKILYAICLLCLVSFAGCDKTDDLPPKHQNFDTNYILPQAPPLSQDERDYVTARRQEYNTATGNTGNK